MIVLRKVLTGREGSRTNEGSLARGWGGSGRTGLAVVVVVALAVVVVEALPQPLPSPAWGEGTGICAGGHGGYRPWILISAGGGCRQRIVKLNVERSEASCAPTSLAVELLVEQEYQQVDVDGAVGEHLGHADIVVLQLEKVLKVDDLLVHRDAEELALKRERADRLA